MNRTDSMRVIAGNAAVIAALLAIAWLLLRLHLGEDGWQPTPLPARRWIALAAVLGYAAWCAALWWRARPRQDDTGEAGHPPLLVVWASQTGFARQLAGHTAQSLRDGGCRVRLRALDQVDAALLAGTRKALFIASTTGEGDPPDHALAFLGQVMRQAPALPDLQYAVLALGDRSYTDYCAFGHRLDDWLRRQGAQPLFDTVEVDNADPAALRHWQQLLAQFGDGSIQADWSTPDYQPWVLQARTRSNPGSVGGPVFQLCLQLADGELPAWQAGDIAEIGPRHAPATVEQWMRAHALDTQATLADGRLLRERLATARLPDTLDGNAPEAIAAALVPVFDRDRELAIAAARSIARTDRIVLIEGNYLLLDQAPWSSLAPLFDFTIFVAPPFEELERRLTARWHGYNLDAAVIDWKLNLNDLPNGRLVVNHSRPADLTIGDF